MAIKYVQNILKDSKLPNDAKSLYSEIENRINK